MKRNTPEHEGNCGRIRHCIFTILLLVATATMFAGCSGDSATTQPQWHAGWAVAQQDYNEEITGVIPPATPISLENQTIRQIAHLSAGGDAVRVKLSNLFGATAVTFDSVHIARSLGGGAVAVDTDTAVTFGGQNKVVLAAGKEIWSDAVPMVTATNMDLAVSIYLSPKTPVATIHSYGLVTNYITAGNAVATGSIPTTQTTPSYYWLAGIDVSGAQKTNVVVAFGDSITDGYGSSTDKNLRYPNQLDTLMQTNGTLGHASIINSGIAGNRWLHDYLGTNGTGRFQRDVLDVSGVTHVVILLGINDIGLGELLPSQSVTVDQVTGAMSAAVTAAKTKGVKVLLATVMPYKGFTSVFPYSDTGEAKRQAINTWIRANTVKADAVIDLDKAMQDPVNSTVLLAAYDSGDHLHPNDAGYFKIAQTVDASLAGLK